MNNPYLSEAQNVEASKVLLRISQMSHRWEELIKSNFPEIYMAVHAITQPERGLAAKLVSIQAAPISILPERETAETDDDNRRIRCNHCMSEFDEEHIIGSRGGAIEKCPVCGRAGALMDIERDQLSAAREQGAREERKKCAYRGVAFALEESLCVLGGRFEKEFRAAIMGDSGQVEE